MGVKRAVARFIGTKRTPDEKSPRFGRVLSACGFGPASNWERIRKLSKEGELRSWMVNQEDTSDGLEEYEKKRVQALNLVQSLEAGGKERWFQLDDLLCSSNATQPSCNEQESRKEEGI